MDSKKTLCKLNIEEKLEETNSIEKYIGDVLELDNFNGLNYLKNNNVSKDYKVEGLEDAEFVSVDIDALAPYSISITEKEFFKIVGANKNSIGKRSGLYQESLYGKYLEAKALKDKGYLTDVLKRAIVLENNMKLVKILMRNKKFMSEWRKNMGEISPMFELKNSGSLNKINIIRSMVR